MAVQCRKGLKADFNANNLLAGELAYCTDTHEFLIGNGDGTASNYGTNLQGQIDNNTWKLSGGTTIPSGADLYSYVTPGNFYHPAANTVTTLLNRPAGLNTAFKMTVYLGNGSEYPVQEFRLFGSSVILRRYYDNYKKVWIDLPAIATSADIAALVTHSTMTNTSGDWAVDKFADGRIEMKLHRVDSDLIFTANKWGNSWADHKFGLTYPVTLIEPTMDVNLVSTTDSAAIICEGITDSTTTSICIVGARPNTVSSVDVLFKICGRWK